MRQMPFAWHDKGDFEELDAAVLEPKTMETVIALTASVLILLHAVFWARLRQHATGRARCALGL